MGGTSMIASNKEIVQETAEIHDLPQKFPVCVPSFSVLPGRCQKIRTPGRVAKASYAIIILFQRDSCEETV